MLAEMPAGLASRWEDFLALEPIGSEIDAMRAAQPAWMLACINRAKTTRAPALSDFAIGYQKPKPRQQSTDELAGLLMEALSVRSSLRSDSPSERE